MLAIVNWALWASSRLALCLEYSLTAPKIEQLLLSLNSHPLEWRLHHQHPVCFESDEITYRLQGYEALLCRGDGMQVQETNQKSNRNQLRRDVRRRWLRECVATLILGVSALASGGCSSLSNLQDNMSFNESWSDWVISQRNSAWSARAWHLRKHHYCNEKYLDDFCAGFRAGYIDVASGSSGCTPAFPPQEYWGWKYQSAEGQGRVAAWFSGYPHGARAAEEDGIGHFTQIQMSSTTYDQYNQAGYGLPETQIYPIPENIPANLHQNIPTSASSGTPVESPAASGIPVNASAINGGVPAVELPK